MHRVVHVELQQKPSTQLPLSQALATVQGWPVTSAQTPLPLQTMVPLASQGGLALSSFWPYAMGVHVPAWPVRLQAKHVAVQAVSQQTPPAQLPLWQASAVVQLAPSTALATQVPVPCPASPGPASGAPILQ